MILVIDIGNTTVALSAVGDGAVRSRFCAPTRRQWGTDAYISALRPGLEGVSCSGAILSSVVPRLTVPVCRAVEALTGISPMVFTHGMNTGLTLEVDCPAQVGTDRLADGAWAAAHFPLPALTADFGTAAVFNLILPGGIFAGGLICPGIQTALDALHRQTSRLPPVEAAHTDILIGKNTQDAMRSGAVRGAAAMVDGLAMELETQLGTPLTLLLTGGGGQFIAPHLRHPHHYDRDMTCKGLALLYSLNEKEKDHDRSNH